MECLEDSVPTWKLIVCKIKNYVDSKIEKIVNSLTQISKLSNASSTLKKKFNINNLRYFFINNNLLYIYTKNILKKNVH